MKLYIITMAINAYDQEGEYFIVGYCHKPNVDELSKIFDVNLAKHICNGGGRRGLEESWYFLREVEEGHEFKE